MCPWQLYLKCGDAVTILLVVVPLAFVLESVGSFRHAKARSLIVLPFARVGLHHVAVQLLVLWGGGRVSKTGIKCTMTSTVKSTG